MPHVRHIVIVIQHIKDPLDIPDSLLIRKLHISLGNHGNLSLQHGNARLLQSFSHRAEIIRSRQNLLAVLFFAEVLRPCVQSQHHQFIRIHLAFFLIDDDLPLLIKHE